MAKACNCPPATALTDIPGTDCAFDLGQLQKFGIQRGGYVWDAAGTPATDPTKKADWLTLKAATDSEKVIFTPLIGGDPIITPGDPITNGGGDNSTLNGVEEITGVNPSVFTGVYKSLSPETKKALTELDCEKDLVIYPINDSNSIFANLISTGKYEGIPITGFHVSDRGNNGFGTKDTFAVRFSLPARWDNDLVQITPETGFRPLQDL